MRLFQKTVFDPVPEYFSHRQQLATYAVRFSVHAIELAHGRLLDQLSLVRGETSELPEDNIIPCLLDAWSIVDNAHRFYMVLNSFPGMRGLNLNDRKFKIFRDAENLRHFYEHMEQLPSGTSKASVFSGLAWHVQESSEAKKTLVKFCAYGLVKKGKIDIFEEPTSYTLPVGAVHLTVGEDLISVSDIALALPSIVSDLENIFRSVKPDRRPW